MPGLKLVLLMVKFTVVGNLLMELGLMLQLPAPNVLGQLKLTVPMKPSCDAIEIGPLVPELRTLTLGKGMGSLSTKSGFIATVRVNDVVSGEAPSVAACRLTL